MNADITIAVDEKQLTDKSLVYDVTLRQGNQSIELASIGAYIDALELANKLQDAICSYTVNEVVDITEE